MKIQLLYKKLNQAIFASLFVGLFAFSACDSSNALLEADSGSLNNVTPSVANLAEKLELTAQQSQDISDLLAQRGADEPGTLWYVAAELQQTLTADQKSELLQGIEEAREKRGSESRSPKTRGQQRFQRRGDNFEEIVGDLTDEQKAELKTLRKKQMEQMKTLFSERREHDATSREEMKEAAEKMRASMEGELQAILTEEQFAAVKAEREEREGEMQKRRDATSREEGTFRRGRRGGRFNEEAREAFSAAKIEALGLTSEQQTQIETIITAQKEKAATLFEEIKASDEGREAVRDKVNALRETSKDAMDEIFTEAQDEIITIHRALAFNTIKDKTGKASSQRGSRRFNRLDK